MQMSKKQKVKFPFIFGFFLGDGFGWYQMLVKVLQSSFLYCVVREEGLIVKIQLFFETM